MLPLAALLSFLVAVRAQSDALGQCYTPHGVYVHNQHPCDDHSQVSSCCPTGWTCFSNNLCIVTSPSVDSAAIGTTSRGTCTHPEWDQEACGNFCLDDDLPGNGGTLTPCGDDHWCCASDIKSGNCDCASGNGTFSPGPGQAVAVVGVVDGLFTVFTGTAMPTSTGSTVQPSSLAAASSSSATASLSSSSAATSSTSASSSSLSFATSTAHLSTASASRPTSVYSAQASSTSAPPPSPTPSAKTIALSVVGGLLLLCLLLALIWYLRRRHPNLVSRLLCCWKPRGGRAASPDPRIYGPTGERESMIGPPADNAPNPHPYHNGHNARAMPPGMGEASGGLGQLRQDISGQPLLDPYAIAAGRADSMSDFERRQQWAAGRGRGRGPNMPRKPLTGGGSVMERELPGDWRTGGW